MSSLNVAMLGCGSFVKSTSVPVLKKMKEYKIYACCDLNENAAEELCVDTGAEYFCSDAGKILNDPKVDVVFITTRHDNHAELTIMAAEAGKHILCEKPMGMNMDECRRIAKAVKKNNVKYTVGYNRGLSPFILKTLDCLSKEKSKKMMYYRMQTPFPAAHWTHDPAVGGGRFVGEGCHIFDILCVLADSPPVSVYAAGGTFLNPEIVKIPDSANVTISFADGSVGTVLISSAGCGSFPKEAAEIYCNGKAIYLNNYQTIEFYGFDVDAKTTIELGKMDKGHKTEFQMLADSIINNTESPNGLEQAARAACISFKVNESLSSGKVIPISENEYKL